MADAIKGLTVVINGDTTPLSRAMGKLNAEAGTLRRHMATVNSQLKFDPASTVLLTNRQRLLNASLTQTSRHLQVLRERHAEYVGQVESMTPAAFRQFQRLEREISQVELRYAQLRAEAISSGAAMSVSGQAAAGSLRKFSTQMQAASGYAVAVSAAVAFAGYKAVQAAYDFESSFAGVRKTIIATEEEYDTLARKARDLALINPVDVNDINRIMELGGQLNIAQEHLVKFADTMARLDVSTDMGLEDGSMQLARFMNITNMGQQDVDRLGAAIVDLGNNSATTESQIMLMAMRIAGSASNIGMTAGDVLGLAASLSAVGIQAEMGGNAIATIMNRIDKDVALNTDTVKVWADTAGMSASEFVQAWTSPSGVTGAFQSVIKGMGEYRDEGGNLNTLLKDMHISYMRQVDTMQRLSRAGSLTVGLMERGNTAMAENTALVRESAQRYDTAESKVQLMKNAFNELGIALGQEILPEFKDVVLGITDAVKAFAAMDSGTKSAIINTGALAVGFGVLFKAVQAGAGVTATLIEGYGKLKTALALAGVEGMTFTQLSIAQSAVLAGNTAAMQANEAAAIRNAQGLSLATVARQTATTWAERHAAASALELAALVPLPAKAALLAGGLVLLAATFGRATHASEDFTFATRKAQGELQAHEAGYDAVVASQGAFSDEAVKMAAKLDEERDALDASKQTFSELKEEVYATADAHAKLMDGIATRSTDAEISAGSILNLVESLKELRDSGGSEGEKVALINALNEQVAGLDMTIDDLNGDLEGNAQAWEAVARAQAEQSRYEAASQNYADLVEEQIDLEGKALKLQQELAAAQADYQAKKDAGAEDDALYRETRLVDDLRGQYAKLSEQIALNKEETEKQAAAMQEHVTHAEALSQAVDAVKTGQMDAAQAAEHYSELLGVLVTQEQVEAESKLAAAQAQEEENEALEDMVESIEKAMAKSDAFMGLLTQSGLSVDEFGQKLLDVGLDAEDLRKGVEDLVSKTTNGLEAMSGQSEVTLEEFIANLESNKELVAEWGDNIKSLFERAGDSSVQGFVSYLQSLGPENASLIAEVAQLSDEELQKVADEYQAGADAAVAAYAGGVGLLPGQVSSYMAKTKDAVESAAQPTGAAASRVGGKYDVIVQKFAAGTKSAVDSVKDLYKGLDKNAPSVEKSASNIGDKATSINKHGSSTYGWGSGLGSNFASGILSQATAVAAASQKLAEAAASKIKHSIPKEGPLHNFGKGEAGWGEELAENFAAGMESRTDRLRDAAQALAGSVSGPLSDAAGMVGGLADWNAPLRMRAQGAATASSKLAAMGMVRGDTNVTMNLYAGERENPVEFASAVADELQAIIDSEGW